MPVQPSTAIRPCRAPDVDPQREGRNVNKTCSENIETRLHQGLHLRLPGRLCVTEYSYTCHQDVVGSRATNLSPVVHTEKLFSPVEQNPVAAGQVQQLQGMQARVHLALVYCAFKKKCHDDIERVPDGHQCRNATADVNFSYCYICQEKKEKRRKKKRKKERKKERKKAKSVSCALLSFLRTPLYLFYPPSPRRTFFLFEPNILRKKRKRRDGK